MPLVAVSGLPVAVAGALLRRSGSPHTPLSVPALTGIILVVGVSTANSVLVSSFARDRWIAQGDTALDAAVDRGDARASGPC
jgi:multidrug efflux pump subunit AcrB